MSEHNESIFENGLDERSKAYLHETTRWTKFLAIMGFIANGFIVLMAFISLLGETTGNLFASFGKVGSFLYFITLAVIYFFPAYFLIRFSALMKRGIDTNDTETITEAFRYQKNFYKYMGILTIICIVLVLLAFVFAGIFAAGLNR